MSRIGEYRLKIYELLFSKPLCNYAELEGKQSEFNVLVIGNGWAGNEAFKAAFWAGQSIGTRLSITVASKNAVEYQQKVLTALPALAVFSSKKGYANLSFKNIFVDERDSGFEPLDIEHTKYNYIIIALGDAEHNWLAASELIELIGRSSLEGKVSYNGSIIMNVFNEFSDCIDISDRETLIMLGQTNGIEVNFFGENNDNPVELERIAHNINFAYEMKYDQRIGKVKADEKFDLSKEAEFSQAPHDYEVDDLTIVSNFIGSNYAADSSYAAAVHIPYKLAVCRAYLADKEPNDILRSAIRSKNGLYKKLVAMEHRRWNAYMVTRGYRAPTESEEEALLYQGANNHQDKQRLIHICLCDCGEAGAILENDFIHQYQLWTQNKQTGIRLSELDRASLRCHQLASNASKKLDPQSVCCSIIGDNTAYNNYRSSIKKLINDEENSLTVYDKAFRAALEYAKSISQRECNQIVTADRLLSAVKARNLRMDFLSLDAQLISMLPFAIWYGKKYNTIITISDGNAAQDVIIPTMFSAHTAIFIGQSTENQGYQRAIKDYFIGRGSVTTPLFIKTVSYKINKLLACIAEHVDENTISDVVFNYVPHENIEVAMAYGQLIERYADRINIVMHDTNGHIVPFSGDHDIAVGLEEKAFSIDEYISLMGGNIKNEYVELYDTTQYAYLRELFESSSGRRYCSSANGEKRTSFVLWNEMSSFFNRCSKDDNIEKTILSSPNNTHQYYSAVFPSSVYEHSLLGNSLQKLQDYKIITDYKEIRNNQSVAVEFEFFDHGIKDALSQFETSTLSTQKEKFTLSQKKLKFSPLQGLKISNCRVDCAVLYEIGTAPELIRLKKSFMLGLERRGFIRHLIFGKEGTEAEGRVSFSFKDEATMSLFKKQGSVHELVLYSLLRESGLFDDIETGAVIAWDTCSINVADEIYKTLNSNDNRAFGYKHYVEIRDSVRRYYTSGLGANVLENEIDVLAIKGMSPIFISCKTGKSNDIGWIYEIASLASHFHALPVLAVTNNLNRQSVNSFVERAEQMGVSLFGAETLWNEEKLARALRSISSFETFIDT